MKPKMKPNKIYQNKKQNKTFQKNKIYQNDY